MMRKARIEVEILKIGIKATIFDVFSNSLSLFLKYLNNYEMI